MELRTLIIRYRKVGYVPKLVQDEFIVYDIIEFLFKEHNIHVDALYHDMKINDDIGYMKFKGTWRTHIGKVYSNSFYCDTYFDNPKDALFDAVKKVLPGLVLD